uniref:NAD(+) kinase n=1 Tax=Graphocephala atropunctata TaxID=36148 RepID=A0A1B6LJF1_9HEMI
MWTILFKRNKKILERVLGRQIVTAAPVHLDRALVLSKMTRYEVEKYCHHHLTEAELEKLIRSRGSNFESLIEHHQRHKDYERYVLETFKSLGIETKLQNRLDYSDSWIESCDAVFPVGGDGTFLLAASRVRQNTKPVIGFNSDPHHSEGFLCLPKNYSTRVKDVIQQLQEGSFSWMFRTRIRVSLRCKYSEPPIELSDKKILGTHRTKLNLGVKNMSSAASPRPLSPLQPALALNEVFVGESLSAQVSYMEMRLQPRGEVTKVKSSGLCVSTGTGSTSWHLSMNRITSHGVQEILRCAGVPAADYNIIADKYNHSLLFDPEEAQMCYTIRDLISAGVWPSPPGLPPRAFAQALWIRSRCRDARLVVDGGTSFTFNDGAEALFELYPEDTLRTVVL